MKRLEIGDSVILIKNLQAMLLVDSRKCALQLSSKTFFHYMNRTGAKKSKPFFQTMLISYVQGALGHLVYEFQGQTHSFSSFIERAERFSRHDDVIWQNYRLTNCQTTSL